MTGFSSAHAGPGPGQGLGLDFWLGHRLRKGAAVLNSVFGEKIMLS